MRTILRNLVRVALGAMLSVGLLVSSAGNIGLAQTASGVSTFNIAHQVTLQYPASWNFVPDAARFPNNPEAAKYSTSQVIGVVSPDYVVGTYLDIISDSSSAVEGLQSLIGADASDPTGHPNFRVVTPVAQAQVVPAAPKMEKPPNSTTCWRVAS